MFIFSKYGMYIRMSGYLFLETCSFVPQLMRIIFCPILNTEMSTGMLLTTTGTAATAASLECPSSFSLKFRISYTK